MPERPAGRCGARAPRAGRLTEGAALAALVWVALGQLGLLRHAGLGPYRGLAPAVVAGALIGWWRAEALRHAAVAVAAVLALVVFTPLTSALLPSVVRRDVGPDARPTVDAVAVLSADVRSDGLVAGQGLERLLAGMAWSRALDRPLVVSVVRDFGRAGAVGSAADQRALTALGGVGRVYYVDSVHVTRDEAVREAALARREGWRRLLVVTSPAHSRRACAAYERAGVAVTCAPSPARDYPLAGPAPLAGAGERVAAFKDWLYEAVGWAVYRARGWV